MIYVVVGMHGGGTSMVSGILHSWGVSMGEDEAALALGTEEQPNGYWEDIEFKTLNRQILYAAGGRWFNVPPAHVLMEVGFQFLLPMLQLVLQRQEGHKHWGFKDPRTALTLPLWQRVLPENTRYVRVVRPVADNVRTLVRRGDRLAENETDNILTMIDLIGEYNRRMNEFFKERSCYLVDFVSLRNDQAEAEKARLRKYVRKA